MFLDVFCQYLSLSHHELVTSSVQTSIVHSVITLQYILVYVNSRALHNSKEYQGYKDLCESTLWC